MLHWIFKLISKTVITISDFIYCRRAVFHSNEHLNRFELKMRSWKGTYFSASFQFQVRMWDGGHAVRWLSVVVLKSAARKRSVSVIALWRLTHLRLSTRRNLRWPASPKLEPSCLCAFQIMCRWCCGFSIPFSRHWCWNDLKKKKIILNYSTLLFWWNRANRNGPVDCWPIKCCPASWKHPLGKEREREQSTPQGTNTKTIN